MENAAKALIFAGSVLISLMIIAVGVYIFQKGQNVSNIEYTRSQTVQIQTFNSQFSIYETIWTYGDNFDQTVTNKDGTTTIARYLAPSSLNTISDVISAANLATSINYQNNYGYNYGFLETISAVEIIIDLSSTSNSLLKYKYYLIEPSADVQSDCVYGTNSISTELSSEARATRISNFSPDSDNETSCNVLLSALNETKLVQYNNSNYTLYKYYFTGEISTNEQTGMIDTVKFTLVIDNNF